MSARKYFYILANECYTIITIRLKFCDNLVTIYYELLNFCNNCEKAGQAGFTRPPIGIILFDFYVNHGLICR